MWLHLPVAIGILLGMSTSGDFSSLLDCQRCVARCLILFLLPSNLAAFIGIPFYDFDGATCHLPAPPLYRTKWLRVGMVTIPVLIVVVVITTNMVLVYLAVRKTQQASQRWRFPAQPRADRSSSLPPLSSPSVVRSSIPDNSNVDVAVDRSGSLRSISLRSMAATGRHQRPTMPPRLQQAVLWQCFFYLASFYLTWPVLLTGQFLFSRKKAVPHWFWQIDFAMVPLQGFWNFLVYARPRWHHYCSCTNAHRRRRQGTQSTETDEFGSSIGGRDRNFLATHTNVDDASNNDVVGNDFPGGDNQLPQDVSSERNKAACAANPGACSSSPSPDAVDAAGAPDISH